VAVDLLGDLDALMPEPAEDFGDRDAVGQGGAARPQPVVVDGALAARWLPAFTARAENPLSLLV
jgi:hypothetical protein